MLRAPKVKRNQVIIMNRKHIGKITEVIGPVVDIRFNDGELPEILNAVEIDNNGKRLVVEVAQHIGDNIVRCVAMSLSLIHI